MAKPPDDGELELVWQLVCHRYGDRLSDEQRADLRQSLEGLIGVVREVRAVALTNADAPLDAAVPWRAPRSPAS